MTAFKRCESLLKEHSDRLKALAQYLFKYEKINGEDFAKLMRGELTVNDDTATDSSAEGENN